MSELDCRLGFNWHQKQKSCVYHRYLLDMPHICQHRGPLSLPTNNGKWLHLCFAAVCALLAGSPAHKLTTTSVLVFQLPAGTQLPPKALLSRSALWPHCSPGCFTPILQKLIIHDRKILQTGLPGTSPGAEDKN